MSDRPDPDRPLLPVEIEIYINSDGSVTFADLEEGVLPIARQLNPDQPLVCDEQTPPASEDRESD